MSGCSSAPNILPKHYPDPDKTIYTIFVLLLSFRMRFTANFAKIFVQGRSDRYDNGPKIFFSLPLLAKTAFFKPNLYKFTSVFHNIPKHFTRSTISAFRGPLWKNWVPFLAFLWGSHTIPPSPPPQSAWPCIRSEGRQKNEDGIWIMDSPCLATNLA